MATKTRAALLAFTVAFSGAAAPGPMLALVISQSLATGTVWATVLILLGHALLEGVLIALLAGGLTKLLRSEKFRSVLALVGGAVLLWMGWGMLANLSEARLGGGADGGAMSWYALILGGMAVSVSNPYFTAWWATVGTGQFASFDLRGPADYAVFWFGHEMGDVGWYIPVSLIVVFGRNWLRPGVYRVVLAVCGILILALAAFFLFSGIRKLVTGLQARTAESAA